MHRGRSGACPRSKVDQTEKWFVRSPIQRVRISPGIPSMIARGGIVFAFGELLQSLECQGQGVNPRGD